MVADPFGAFVRDVDVQIGGAAEGPLVGLTFAAKDLFDVEGFVTGAGSPEWKRTHGPATKTASAVQTLVDAGASLVGKTQTDEMAFSLNGENAHYGTPTNPAAPDRMPGGSSSGSVVAVAAATVDFALGTDTGGSVRLPASFCGVYGMRPSHGAIPIDGVVPLAPSLDTVGWFARDAEILRRVGSSLLPPNGTPQPPRQIRLLADAFRISQTETAEAIQARLRKHADRLPEMLEVTLPLALFDEWLIHYEAIQFSEVWEQHGAWVTETDPQFGPGVKERFERAKAVPAGAAGAARRFREEARQALDELIPVGTLLALPTSPRPAIPLNPTPEEANATRTQRLKLLCLAGLAGLPQLSIPAGIVDGAPIGLSFIAPRGEDQNLLAFASWQRGLIE